MVLNTACPSWWSGHPPHQRSGHSTLPPGNYSHPIVITTNWHKLSLQERKDIVAFQDLLSIVWLTSFLQLNSDAHVHKMEDNLSEANAQLAEVDKSQAEINAIRLQGKFLDSFVQCYLPLIFLFPYISSSSGSPALSPLVNLPHPSSLCFSFSPVRSN